MTAFMLMLFCILGFGRESQPAIDLTRLKSPVLFRGDAVHAYRDPTAIYYEGVFHLFFTYVRTEEQGKIYMYVAESRSTDLVGWTTPEILTAKDQNLNFSSPGNIVQHKGEWVLCLQTYPRPKGEKFGNASARIWTMRSKDLKKWEPPELLRVKGPDVPVEEMGRMIDAYLLEDKDTPGKWWAFYKQKGCSISYSNDLKTWTYFDRVDAGENACVLVVDNEYVLFHSPKNGIGVKRSPDLRTWRDAGRITLGQKDWSWAKGRLTAGYVLDLKKDPRVGKYLMFFHGSGPEDERTMFDSYASIGIAWSDDLVSWDWPGRSAL